MSCGGSGVLQRFPKAHDQATARRLQKEATKKLVRASNVLRLPSDCSWPETLEEFALHFSAQFPDMAEQMAFFLAHAKTPWAASEVFNEKLAFFVDWMQERQR